MIEIIEPSVSLVGVSKLDPHPLDRPNSLISTQFQPELMLLSVGDRFPCLRPNASRSSAGFSSPKPKPPDPTDVIYKFGQLR